MATTRLTRNTSTLNQAKPRQSGTARQPCFTLKRTLIFQVRKSLVEYVDEELLKMHTSVFYQRIFILAKNVDPARESAIKVQAAPGPNKRVSTGTTQSNPDGDTGTLRTADVMAAEDEQQHYSDPSTPAEILPDISDVESRKPLNFVDPTNAEQETVTRTFNFDWDDDAPVEAEPEEAEPEPEPEVVAGPKDRYTLFMELLEELQKKCRHLSYTPDPMCGLLVYMNDYTMLMLESGEDMMGIFCTELLACVDEFWQSNRVVMIEDHITDLYTKELIFRRIPAVFLNEKFPPSTPTDEHLMGKQHLIIKEKMHTICGLIRDSLEQRATTEMSVGDSGTGMYPTSEAAMEAIGEGIDEEHEQATSHMSMQANRMSARLTATLAPDIFRRLLPEIQRIELVLASTRFYYTLAEFVDLYGKVPFGRDDDGFYWPIQNNYTPANIFRRTPFDINLTFADYAADMNRRMLEEQQKHKEEMEAAAAAEASAAEQAQGHQGQSRPHGSHAPAEQEEE
ncbi:hypothetical protein ACLKA7_017192 [Drosophila subpalustris]